MSSQMCPHIIQREMEFVQLMLFRNDQWELLNMYSAVRMYRNRHETSAEMKHDSSNQAEVKQGHLSRAQCCSSPKPTLQHSLPRLHRDNLTAPGRSPESLHVRKPLCVQRRTSGATSCSLGPQSCRHFIQFGQKGAKYCHNALWVILHHCHKNNI